MCAGRSRTIAERRGRDEDEIDALIDWLRSGRSGTGTAFEALPQWMITDRAKVIARLRELREQ